MDLEYYKLSPQERDINKLNRIADELITQGGKRLSGTKTSPVHHLFPLGDEYVNNRRYSELQKFLKQTPQCNHIINH